jgi:hypothetical protein
LALLAPSLLFFPAEMLAVDAMPVLRLRPLALASMLATLVMLPALLRALPAWVRLCRCRDCFGRSSRGFCLRSDGPF